MVACSGCIMVKHAGIKLHLMPCHSFNCILFIYFFNLSFIRLMQKGGKRLFVLLLLKM